jgi:hypothetical protein
MADSLLRFQRMRRILGGRITSNMRRLFHRGGSLSTVPFAAARSPCVDACQACLDLKLPLDCHLVSRYDRSSFASLSAAGRRRTACARQRLRGRRQVGRMVHAVPCKQEPAFAFHSKSLLTLRRSTPIRSNLSPLSAKRRRRPLPLSNPRCWRVLRLTDCASCTRRDCVVFTLLSCGPCALFQASTSSCATSSAVKCRRPSGS